MEIDWITLLDRSMFLLISGILVVIFLFFVFVLANGIYSVWLFIGERNPYRRSCRKCGQQQVAFCRSWSWNNQWWEDMMPVPDDDCICHSYSTYHS